MKRDNEDIFVIVVDSTEKKDWAFEICPEPNYWIFQITTIRLSDSLHMFIKPQKLCISIVLQRIGLRKLQNRKEQTFIW
jgi:hypothetical protein